MLQASFQEDSVDMIFPSGRKKHTTLWQVLDKIIIDAKKKNGYISINFLLYNNVDGMANSEDPDQSSLIWIYTVCPQPIRPKT